MKGVILAGGHGTRLHPLTHTTQKQLLPVANKPVLEYVIGDFVEAGIDEIGIILGGSYPEQIKDQFGGGTEYGVDITYIYQGEPKGLAHAVGCASEFVDDDDFVVYFGDTIVLGGIVSEIVDAFKPDHHTAAICLQEVETPSRFGIAEFDDEDRLKAVHEKPDEPPTDLAYIGVLAFSPAVFEVIDRINPSWRGELELTDVLDELARSGDPIHWQQYSDVWMDVGTPEDLLETNRILLDHRKESFTDEVAGGATVRGPVEIGPDLTVTPDIVIEGPVSIGSDVTIESGAHIGPYVSLGDSVEINGATIRSSVLLPESTVIGERVLSQSILGTETIVRPSTGDAEQYVVGNNSDISLQ